MYDHQTDSLWSHILGQAISGEYKGTRLTFIPALQTDWQTWQELHPDTLVVDPDRFSRDVYASYYASGEAGVLGSSIPRDGDLYIKEFVVGVRLKGETRAYPFSILNKEPVVNDELAGDAIVVFFDKASASGAVFSRQLDDGQVLTFAAGAEAQQAVDTAGGSVWNTLTGKAISGPLRGRQLAQIPATYAFWFGWADYHPNTTVYSPNAVAPTPTPAESGNKANADVIFVKAAPSGAQRWTFSVTVSHPDTGWDDYADGWDVVLPDGSVIKPNPDAPFTRLLLHPHTGEQPFTRSQSNIQIPADVSVVTVRAHDWVDGWGGAEVLVDLSQEKGAGFEVSR